MRKSSLVLLALAFLPFCGVLAKAEKPPSTYPFTPVYELEKEARQNDGDHMRLRVFSPHDSGMPWVNGPYQITLPEGYVFPNGARFVRGRTDGQGRTEAIALNDEMPELYDWLVEPIYGKGSYDQSVALDTDAFPYRNHQELREYQKLLEKNDLTYAVYEANNALFLCSRIRGENGNYPTRHIRYFSSSPKAMVYLQILSSAACADLKQKMATAMHAPSLEGKLRALRQLKFTSIGARSVVENRIAGLLLAEGSPTQLAAYVTAETKNLDAKWQAWFYNNLGYKLLDQNKRKIAYAESLIDLSIALAPDVYNLDSKAQARYLSGDLEAALYWADRSLSSFGGRCSISEKSVLPITYQHRGIILWELKRYDEAVTNWARAYLHAGDFAWAEGGSDQWTDVLKTLVLERAEEMRQFAAPDGLCKSPKIDPAQTPAPARMGTCATDDEAEDALCGCGP